MLRGGKKTTFKVKQSNESIYGRIGSFLIWSVSTFYDNVLDIRPDPPLLVVMVMSRTWSCLEQVWDVMCRLTRWEDGREVEEYSKWFLLELNLFVRKKLTFLLIYTRMRMNLCETHMNKKRSKTLPLLSIVSMVTA